MQTLNKYSRTSYIAEIVDFSVNFMAMHAIKFAEKIDHFGAEFMFMLW